MFLFVALIMGFVSTHAKVLPTAGVCGLVMSELVPGSTVEFLRGRVKTKATILSVFLGGQKVTVYWTGPNGTKLSKEVPASELTLCPPILRRYPPVSFAVDTLALSADQKVKGANESGVPLFRDDEILKIHSPTSTKTLKSGTIEVTVETIEGKAVIQQQAIRSGSATAVAMLILDQGKEPVLQSLFFENEGDALTRDQALTAIGLSVVHTAIGPDEDVLQADYLQIPNRQIIKTHTTAEALALLVAALKKNGSAILMLNVESPTGLIILDRLDLEKQEATLRDPYHGWMITVSIPSLIHRTGSHFSFMQVRK